MPIITLLLEHKEFILILVLILGIFAGLEYVKHLHTEVENLKTTNSVLSANLETSNKSIKTLQESINQQNAAVAQLKSAADQRAQSHATEIAAANIKADSYRQQAIDILKSKPQDADKCKSSNDLINSEILRNGKK